MASCFGYLRAVPMLMMRLATLPIVTPEARQPQTQVLSAELVCGLILGHVPHVFGQLVWISSLRVGESGEYRCWAFDSAVTPEVASEAMRLTHVRVFTQWLGLGIEAQYKDLAQYLASDQSAEQLLKDGFRLKKLIPASAHEGERMLFLADLEMIMGLMELG